MIFIIDNITVEAETADVAWSAMVTALNLPLEKLRPWALTYLNTWRGARRAALGLTSAAFQELVYTGKVLECQRWLGDTESNFGLALEATARGLSNQDMALLVLVQWSAWAAGSDSIEAAYITARAAVEAAGDEAAVAAALAGVGYVR